jgi:hypothetical protein
MAGTISADTITSASDLVATYDVEAVGLTLTGNVTGVKGIFSGSINTSAVTTTGNVTAVKGIFSGSLNATDATLTGDVIAVDVAVTGCAYAPTFAIDALSSTSVPTITAASYAPGATHYAWPGSLWIATAVSGTAGSAVANGCLYMNASASGATGSTWSQLDALRSA